ncbi:hypothetical protein [Streptomyces chromofuscus]|uniref:Uncharacterized protein n=1 Tax=Streptomyces chromofuscus TaxID=42881 RepID=A0A7M2TAH1_STRCW|nr:hypothetical protein [Streptomyces chromofuscus]QOV44341.1 hypothetical protein IPT68_32745 [Streptomyces chromofuscus]GGT23435.1 hypothetical protein GCM10010254_49900 [Streptomyces chromofuscus]
MPVAALAEIGGFDVEVVRNERAHVVSVGIDDFFSDRSPGDTPLLDLSCHGLKSESGELYFAAGNTVHCCYGGASSRGAS